MPNEGPCLNERKGLQECLPGVTLHYSNVYYQQRYPSRPYSRQPHELDQLQQHILISNSMNKRTDNRFSGYSAGNSINAGMDDESSSSSIHVLRIGNDENQNHADHCDGDFEDMASFSISIRRAAATSEARRRSEQRWLFYVKISLVAIVFLMLWDEFRRGTTTQTTYPNDVRSTGTNQRSFRLDKHWNKMNTNPMYAGQQQDGTDDDEKRQILVVLKDLDEAIGGDIVLRSNKTKFQNVARVWQRKDFIVQEEEGSSFQPNLPPFAVVEAATLEDVQLAVPILAGLARDYRLGFRVRSGGHAYMSGYSTISDGIVLSLGKLDSIAVDSLNHDSNEEEVGHIRNDLNATKGIKENCETSTLRSTSQKTVIMGPGVRTEQFMKDVLDANGYSGIVASAAGVAMGGYISGGGYGLQSRMYGLAIDNVVSLQVVLASGEIKNVKSGEDLFWALRGAGGGNIGVVTSMEYRVYPSHDIKLAATVKVSLAEMTRFLQRLGDKESDLAPEFTLNVHGYKAPGNSSIPDLSQRMADAYIEQNSVIKDENEEDWLVTISMFWMGDSNPDDPVGMEYIKEEIIPLFSNSSTTDGIVYYYFSWSGMSREREQRPEFKSVWSAQSWNGFLLPGNNTKEVWTDIESSLSAMFRYCKYVSPRVELWGGAISKIPFNATAFPYREAVYNIGIDLLVPTESDVDVASDEMHLANAIWPSIARHLDGVYVNYPMASLSNESYPTAYWGKNLDRLVKLKERYDPFDAFKTAQSIPIQRNDSSSQVHQW